MPGDIILYKCTKKHDHMLYQPWESTAAFGNAIVNADQCWFYDGKKMLLYRFSHMWSFFSGFTVLLIIPERFNLVYN